MKCMNCEKEYTAFNEDAGTYKQYFCSLECKIQSDDDIELKKKQWSNNDVNDMLLKMQAMKKRIDELEAASVALIDFCHERELWHVIDFACGESSNE